MWVKCKLDWYGFYTVGMIPHNILWTDTGIYSIQAEYYIQNGNVVYTGGTRYVLNARFCSYDHQDTIEFDYQTYFQIGDGTSSPAANIHLIYDYWGNEKMILSSDDIGENYKISQAEHYNRNQYNKIGGTSVDVLYPTRNSLGDGFGEPLGVNRKIIRYKMVSSKRKKDVL